MQKNYIKTGLMKLSLQILLYISIFLCFYGCLSVSLIGLRNISRTSVIVSITYWVLMILLTAVYGGFDLGIRKRRSVFASFVMNAVFADTITYVVLQVMNVNPKNPEANASLELIGEDLALLLGAFVLQILLIYFFVSCGFRFYRKLNPPKDCCLIVSSQSVAEHVAQKMATFPRRFRLTEVVHYTVPDLEQTILNHDAVFLAEVPDTEEAQIECMCYRHQKSVYLMAELEDVILSTSRREVLEDTAFLSLQSTEITLLQRFVKRAADIVISAVGLLITSPVLLAVAIILKSKGNGSVIFKQKRATLNGRPFEIYKFRTMFEDVDNYSATEGDSRITPVGRVLRKYRLDEIPQLYNVLKGDMSLVGPRPEMLENVARYTSEVPEFVYRQRMKAGLTGLAQIEGKYNTTPQDKAMLDLLYIESFSLTSDFILMLRTFTVFLRHDSTEGFTAKTTTCPEMRCISKEAQEALNAKEGKMAKEAEIPDSV